MAVVPSPTSTTVLLIDGHKQEREYWAQRLTLSSQKYVVLEADTGAAGLAACRSHRVDCVVLELVLPDVAGFELLVQLISGIHHRKLPVIFLSRISFESISKLAIDNGAQGFLIKSLTSGDDLDKAIQKAIAAVGPNKHREL